LPARSVSYSSGVDGHLEQLDLADGWSELWFDDYAPFQRAYPSPEWAAMEADGATLFMAEKGIVIGREYVQKDDGWKPRDYGALGLSEDQIRDRLPERGIRFAGR
jgi:hypothetical protein